MSVYARVRRNRGSWYAGLQENHAKHAGIEAEQLVEYDEAAELEGAVLISVDQPAPTRGYALVALLKDGTAFARIHVIPRQTEETYRALFSAIAVVGGTNGGTVERVHVDTSVLADYVSEKIEKLGGAYGITTEAPSEGSPTLEAARSLNETGGLVLEGPEPEVFEEPVEVDETQASDDEAEGELESTPENPIFAVGEEFFEQRDESPSEEAEAVEDRGDLPEAVSAPHPEGTEVVELDVTPEAEEVVVEGELTEEDEAEPDVEPEEDEFVCGDCGKSFATPRGLTQHSRTHD